jgi:hypothetical protein
MLNQNVLNIHLHLEINCINCSVMEDKEKQQKSEQENEISVTDAYISQMSPFELSAYRIAKGHLGTSFNLRKSNGFLKWISKK